MQSSHYRLNFLVRDASKMMLRQIGKVAVAALKSSSERL